MDNTNNNNNYPSYSYPDSGDSSPRSRETDFETPQPSWEDQPHSQAPKVKFMVSYGGKIQPRSYDNLLSYLGGETKILAVDRGVKFSFIYSKLASLVAPDGSGATGEALGFKFKYQLPGEDLDALISVTNDDDLEHMMHEYDRLCKVSNKPARLRLFLFSDHQLSRFSSFSSEPGKISGPERDQNCSGVVLDPTPAVSPSPLPPPPPPAQPMPQPVHNNNNVDFLFGLDNVPVQVAEPEVNRVQISSQEYHNLQHQQQQQQNSPVYAPKNDENFGDPYQKAPSPANIPVNMQIPQGYWQPIEQQVQQLQHQQSQTHMQQMTPQQLLQQQQQQHQQYIQQQAQQQPQQPVYMVHGPPPPQGNVFQQLPVGVQMQPNLNQGYYQVQRMQQPPVYSMPPPATMTPVSAPSQVYYAAAAAVQGGAGMVAAAAAVSGDGEGKVVAQKAGNFAGGV